MNTTAFIILGLAVHTMMFTHQVAAQSQSATANRAEARELQEAAQVRADSGEADATLDELKQIALDQQRDSEERIAVILKIGRLNSPAAADFLLENISIKIHKDQIRADDDAFKQEPCFYSLKSMGTNALPHLFRFIEKPRQKQQLKELSRLLVSTLGPEKSRKLLQEKEKSVQPDAIQKDLHSNLQELIRTLPSGAKSD